MSVLTLPDSTNWEEGYASPGTGETASGRSRRSKGLSEDSSPDIPLRIRTSRPDINVKTFPYPIESREPIVSAWESLRPEIVSLLRGKDWLSLSVVRRGKPRGPRPPTVVLTISKSSKDDWVAVREDIVRGLDLRDLNYVAVEILRDDKMFGDGGGEYDGRLLLDNEDFAAQVTMGRSIGPTGSSKHPSTFGGFVKTKNKDGEWLELGLTCFHRVAPAGSNHHAWQDTGIYPDDERNDLHMDSPSLGDIEESERAWQLRVDDGEKPEYKDVERWLEFVTPNEKEKFLSARAVVSSYRGKMQVSQEFRDKMDLGKVFAGSGLRLTDGEGLRALDWALIDVSKSRNFGVGNNAPTSEELPKYPRLSGWCGGGAIRDVAPLVPDMLLFKTGRSTGFTVGRLNGIEKSTLHSWKWDGLGNLVEVESQAYCVLPDSSFNRNGGGPSSFGKGGDSGSFMMDRTGSFVGLYFAGSTSSNIGFFMGADDLIADIKRITGAVEVSFDV